MVKIIAFLHVNKYEVLLVALIQHLYIGIFLQDSDFYTEIVWPINILIVGVASIGVFIRKGRWKKIIQNILFLLVLVLQYARDGVQVNAVGTNYMDFPGFLKASRADADPERRAAIEAQVPMRKLGTMDELAAFTSVLLDGTSRFQTGQFFSFSGGWST